MAFSDQMAVADQAILAALGDAAYLVTGGGINLGALQGVFERQYVEVRGAESMHPTFSALEVDLPTDVHDCTLTYGGTSYRVVRPEPEGGGLTLLILERK